MPKSFFAILATATMTKKNNNNFTPSGWRFEGAIMISTQVRTA